MPHARAGIAVNEERAPGQAGAQAGHRTKIAGHDKRFVFRRAVDREEISQLAGLSTDADRLASDLVGRKIAKSFWKKSLCMDGESLDIALSQMKGHAVSISRGAQCVDEFLQESQGIDAGGDGGRSGRQADAVRSKDAAGEIRKWRDSKEDRCAGGRRRETGPEDDCGQMPQMLPNGRFSIRERIAIDEENSVGASLDEQLA
jgi:hypothetical protein